MLVIRREQMELFEGAMRRRLRSDALAELQAKRPRLAQQLGAEALSQWVIEAERRIDEFDGILNRDLKRYGLLMADFGRDFQSRHAWAAAVIADPEVPGPSKLDVLEVDAAAARGALNKERDPGF